MDGDDYTRLDGSLLAEIAAAVGPDGLIVDPERLAAFDHDETERLRFPPEAVVLPRGTDEVSAVLRVAHRERIPVTPRGAGTGLSGGALPVHGGLVLSVERLDRVLRLDRANATLEVEAGVTTAAVHAAAEAAGLLYPPDPASADSCQIGGNIAEDSAGPRSCKYGTTRRWVAGLEAVLADGTVISTGGPARKNATGYDLTQLIVGSEGTLAVVTRALLRLAPAPGHVLTLGAEFPDLESAAAGVVEVFGAGLDPAACELLESNALRLVHAVEPLPEDLRAAGALMLLRVEADDRDAALAVAARCEAVLADAGSGDLRVAEERRDQRRLWRARSLVGEAVKRHSAYKEIDAVVPRTALADLVRAARAAAERQGLEAVCYGHAGDGNLHVNLLRGELPDDAWERARDAAEDEIVGRLVDLDGALTGEHGVGWVQRRHLPRVLAPGTLEAMARIKRAWDPRGILNPSKIFPASRIPRP